MINSTMDKKSLLLAIISITFFISPISAINETDITSLKTACSAGDSCHQGTYINDFPITGLLTVYGADPVPVYGTNEVTTTSTTTTSTTTTTTLQIGNILINEFQPNPDGTDAGNEWVELYNKGSTEVSLSGWTLETLPLSGLISPYGFKQIIFPTLTLTNTGDIIVLKYGNATVDRVVYGNVDDEIAVVAAPPSGESAGRIPDGSSNWTIFAIPTIGSENIVSSTPTTTITTTTTTILEACPKKGDKASCDGSVDDFELLDYINQWTAGYVKDFDLLEAVNNWAKG